MQIDSEHIQLTVFKLRCFWDGCLFPFSLSNAVYCRLLQMKMMPISISIMFRMGVWMWMGIKGSNRYLGKIMLLFKDKVSFTMFSFAIMLLILRMHVSTVFYFLFFIFLCACFFLHNASPNIFIQNVSFLPIL